MSTAEIISIPRRREEMLEAKWEVFRDASVRAQLSRDIQDGIAAGRAWREFLDLFLAKDQQEAIGKAPVLRMPGWQG